MGVKNINLAACESVGTTRVKNSKKSRHWSEALTLKLPNLLLIMHTFFPSYPSSSPPLILFHHCTLGGHRPFTLFIYSFFYLSINNYIYEMTILTLGFDTPKRDPQEHLQFKGW